MDNIKRPCIGGKEVGGEPSEDGQLRGQSKWIYERPQLKAWASLASSQREIGLDFYELPFGLAARSSDLAPNGHRFLVAQASRDPPTPRLGKYVPPPPGFSGGRILYSQILRNKLEAERGEIAQMERKFWRPLTMNYDKDFPELTPSEDGTNDQAFFIDDSSGFNYSEDYAKNLNFANDEWAGQMKFCNEYVECQNCKNRNLEDRFRFLQNSTCPQLHLINGIEIRMEKSPASKTDPPEKRKGREHLEIIFNQLLSKTETVEHKKCIQLTTHGQERDLDEESLYLRIAGKKFAIRNPPSCSTASTQTTRCHFKDDYSQQNHENDILAEEPHVPISFTKIHTTVISEKNSELIGESSPPYNRNHPGKEDPDEEGYSSGSFYYDCQSSLAATRPPGPSPNDEESSDLPSSTSCGFSQSPSLSDEESSSSPGADRPPRPTILNLQSPRGANRLEWWSELEAWSRRGSPKPNSRAHRTVPNQPAQVDLNNRIVQEMLRKFSIAQNSLGD